MPWGDGTGPRGEGPMTGRGMGYCSGYDRPGYANPGFGRGAGFGRGRGFGRGFGGGRGRRGGFRNWARATGLPGWYRERVGMPAFGRGWAPGWAPVRQPPVQQTSQASRFVQPRLTRDQEIEMLKDDIKYLRDQKKLLEEEMGSVEKRLKELKGKK